MKNRIEIMINELITAYREANPRIPANTENAPYSDIEYYDTPLDSFRRGGFAKGMTTFTVSMFLWVFYLSPNAHAMSEPTQQEKRQAAYDAMMEKTPEAKLAYRLQKLKNKITLELPDEVEERAANSSVFNDWKNAFGLGDLPVSEAMLEEIDAVAAAIEEAEAAGMAGFDLDEENLKANGKLSKEARQLALQRHQDAKQLVQQRFEELKTRLKVLKQASKKDQQHAAFEALKAFLEQQQFQQGHTPVDPNNLPFGAPKATPIHPETDGLALYQKTHEPILLADSSGAIPASVMGLLGASVTPTDAELAETIDTTRTQAIVDLAAELNHDPIEIYTWVANNIRYVPSYGSIQGADMTLQTKRGNDMDTASLLIALLRASDIPARYAYGTVDIPIEKAMNWVGGVEVPAAVSNLMWQGGVPNTLHKINGEIKYLRKEHTWVEAWVDFEPSRGVKNIEGDSWIPMDASFKQYEFIEPEVDLQAEVPFDAESLVSTIEQNTTVNEAEGWVQTNPADPAQLQTQIEAALTDYQAQLETYLEIQQPDATVGEVLGLQEIKIKQIQPLSAGLPYQLVAKQQSFSEIADQLRLKFKYSLYTQFYGQKDQQILTIEEPTVNLAGKKLALSFKPATQADEDLIASYIPEPDPVTGEIDPSQLPDTLPGYLIKMTPEFSVDYESVTDVTSKVLLGTELISEMGYKLPNRNYELTKNLPVAGEYRAIALKFHGISEQLMNSLLSDINEASAVLASGDDQAIELLGKHRILGSLLQATVYSYFNRNYLEDTLASRQNEVIQFQNPSYGVFQTSLVPKYFFGVQQLVDFGGLITDIDRYSTSVADVNNADTSIYTALVGARLSALESEGPKQMYSTGDNQVFGISAASAIRQASLEGQRIWSISASNIDFVLNQLNLPLDVITEITNSVAAGRVVYTHTDTLYVSGQPSAGFIVQDPATGSSAYRILGGFNGGEIVEPNKEFDPFALLGISSAHAGDAGTNVVKTVNVMNCVIHTVLGLIGDFILFKAHKNLGKKGGLRLIIKQFGRLAAKFFVNIMLVILTAMIISSLIMCLSQFVSYRLIKTNRRFV